MASTAACRARGLPWTVSPELLLARCAVGIGIAGFLAYWVRIAAQRWDDFETNAFDLGFFDQIVWNTAHGRLFETTFVDYNFAGQHFEPVLLLFVPAYRLGAGPLFLVVTQAVVAGLAAAPLFEAARRLGLRPLVAAAVASAYLVNAYLHRALLFDFHPETMVVAPAFASAWAAAAGRPRLAAALALSVLLFKEDAVFVALGLGAFLWWLGYRRAAATTIIVSTIWTALVLGALMPLLRDGAPGDIGERYVAVSGGHEGIAAAFWFGSHPADVLRAVLTTEHLGTAARFVAGSAPTMLAAPLSPILLLPGLMLALLSTHPSQSGLELHYAAELVPVAMLGLLLGLRRLKLFASPALVAAAVLAPALAGFLMLSPVSPLAAPGGARPSEAHRAAVRGALAMIPDGVAVSAQSGLLPRLSQREEVYEFPREWDNAEWVIADQRGFRSTQSIDSGYDRALEEVRTTYRLMYERDGVMVFREAIR